MSLTVAFVSSVQMNTPTFLALAVSMATFSILNS